MRRGNTGLPDRVVVIGAGFIGTNVAAGLLAAGVETVVVTRSPLSGRRAKALESARVIVCDASARELVRPHLAGVAHVVYCASGLMPGESNLDPIVDAGLSIPPLINLLELLRDAGGAGFTYLSSGGTVYGAVPEALVAESHPTEPITSYGVMKLMGEKYALMYARLYGIPVRILRCANVYGEHQPATRGQGMVAVCLDRVARERPVTVFGDGSIVRDYVYVGDVVEAILRSIQSGDGSSILNVGSGEGVSLRELIVAIEKVTDRPVTVDPRPDRGFDVARVVLDIGKARHELGLEPMGLEEGLTRTWQAVGRTAAG